MIIPISLGLTFWQARRHRRQAAAGVTTAPPAVPWRRMFPWFIAYFLAAVAANSLGLIPHGWHAPLSQAAVFLITTAPAGMGYPRGSTTCAAPACVRWPSAQCCGPPSV
jgi:uncharacterized membrane protein YadS